MHCGLYQLSFQMSKLYSNLSLNKLPSFELIVKRRDAEYSSGRLYRLFSLHPLLLLCFELLGRPEQQHNLSRVREIPTQAQ